MRCFNPLPPPKRGEIISEWDCHVQGILVSIRSPRRSEGRCLRS